MFRDDARFWRSSALLRIGVALAATISATVIPMTSVPKASATARPADVAAASTIDCGNGSSLVRPAVPTGFDARIATADQLRTIDFPPRPSDSAALSIWLQYAARYQAGAVDFGSTCNPTQTDAHSSPPQPGRPVNMAPNLVPADGSAPSINWSGNVDHNALYTDAESMWFVPSVDHPHSPVSYASTWVGVGLGGSLQQPNYNYPLVQAGSESRFGCGISHNTVCPSYAWFEVWPWEPYEQRIPQLSNIEGDLLFVHVRFTHNSTYNRGDMVWHVVDLNQGIDLTLTDERYGTNPDGHAEFITERPVVDNALGKLADFGSVTYFEAQAASASGWRGVGNLPHYWHWMISDDGSSRVLAKPGAISSDGYSFSINWSDYD